MLLVLTTLLLWGSLFFLGAQSSEGEKWYEGKNRCDQLNQVFGILLGQMFNGRTHGVIILVDGEGCPNLLDGCFRPSIWQVGSAHIHIAAHRDMLKRLTQVLPDGEP